MGTRIPRFATRAMKSVVIVTDKERGGDYCSGFVVVEYRRADAGTAAKTLVVAPTGFVKGKKELRVSFYDGVRSLASVVAEEPSFSLLTTTAHSKCEAVGLLEEFNPSSFLPRPTFVVPPISSTKTCYVPTYATLESLASATSEGGIYVDSSEDYFLISCDHPDMTHSGLSRLAASPVFINETTKLAGLTMGFVLQVSHIGNDRMKVAVTSTCFKKILNKLDPPAPPRKPRLFDLPQKRGGGVQNQGSSGQKRKRFH